MSGRRHRRTLALVIALVVFAAACSGAVAGGDDGGGTDGDSADAATDSAAAAASGSPPDWPWDRAAAGEDVQAIVPLSDIQRGGPPPDGIPPIDDPQFEDVEAAGEWLTERDPIMLVEVNDEVKAYPLAILTWHEVANDEVGGEPLVVTYCPLCNSGLVFERTVDGEVLDFGTSGRLYNSNLVMYDRATRSLWSQFTGEAIVGPQVGTTLERVPMQIVAFSELAERWPDAPVLSRETGESRPYGNNPYVGYDSAEAPFLFDGPTGGPLPQMARVVTTGGETDPVAFPWDILQEERVVSATINDEPIVVLWAPGTASALAEEDIGEAEDIGAAGVFSRVVDGRELTFEADGEDRFRDGETGSTWSVTGRAIAGPLEGTALERVPHDDTFWFVQFAFRPDTRVAGRG